ncbi:two-component system response regulator [Bacillus sp. AFS076308]|uniref:response regulator n=1 Tax=unclassified Bacillus (in: firmicutes) TaxID=185979 RepID=UPI000BF9B9AD|nr:MULTISPECIES: response regulator [unclassified Bacillus (in: firmicutes)]PFO06853.1 two-component system response regulator [Bacillus sp. AFS076308]PGV55308.1 two-component system response regulator [Bacillus sp. AFS037270]
MKGNRDIEVLIVEDDLRIAEIQKRFLDLIDGFQAVGIAASYVEAKTLIEILQPDLILLDVYFPDMNGLELLKETKILTKQIDVIMITAAKEIEKVQSAIRLGVFDYIIKPVIFDRFKQSLQRYKDYHEELFKLSKENSQVSQQEVDKLLWKENDSANNERAYLPKGIDPLTLEKVIEVLGKDKTGLTAETVAKEVGVSRTTARRYLEHLVSIEKIEADLSYGTVGRPERVYILVDMINKLAE